MMADAPPSHPGVKIPPPILFAVGFGAAAWLNRIRPLRAGTDAWGWEVAGLVLIAGALVLIFWAIRTFSRAKTAILPNRPASMLVLGGPYLHTRNPMYVGFTAAYLGGTILLDSLWPLGVLPFVLLVLTRAVIHREERYLTAAFGDEYEQYKGAVPRWF